MWHTACSLMAFQQSVTLYYCACTVYWPYIHAFLHLLNLSEPFYWWSVAHISIFLLCRDNCKTLSGFVSQSNVKVNVLTLISRNLQLIWLLWLPGNPSRRATCEGFLCQPKQRVKPNTDRPTFVIWLLMLSSARVPQVTQWAPLSTNAAHMLVRGKTDNGLERGSCD